LTNNYTFYINKYPYFFKILLQGIQNAKFDLFYIYIIDSIKAKILSDLTMMNNKELNVVCCNFDEFNNFMISSLVITQNILLYVQIYCKYEILQKYQLNHLKALYKGFSSNILHYNPSFCKFHSIMNKKKTITSNTFLFLIIVNLQISDHGTKYTTKIGDTFYVT
jgi:hypothetical protein